MAKGEMPDWLYIGAHPLDTLKAIGLRAETRVLDDFAPTNYLGIPLADAVRAVVKNRQKTSNANSGGVRLMDWPKSVQGDVSRGQVIHPDGRHPEHLNV